MSDESSSQLDTEKQTGPASDLGETGRASQMGREWQRELKFAAEEERSLEAQEETCRCR